MIKEVYPTVYNLSTQMIERKGDLIAEETPLHIFLNQTHYVTILCSPRQLKELSIGHLLSEGILRSADDIQEIRLEGNGMCWVRLKPHVDPEKRISVAQPFSRLIVSACGSPDYWPIFKLIDRLSLSKVPSGLTVEAKVIAESVRHLNTLAETFRKTGGVHVAALYSTSGELKAYAEDVGRHNAVDKVIGAGVLGRVEFQGCFLASSGRLTGDIVLKAARMRIPIVASMAAVISSGVEAAHRTGVTLIGFVRGKRMSVFTYPERIVINPSLASAG